MVDTEPIYLPRYADESLMDKFADFIHTYAIGIVLTTGLVFNAYEGMYPSPIFGSSADRSRFFDSIEKPESRVIALVASWCAACKHLERELAEEKIPFTKVDIEASHSGKELFDRCVTSSGSAAIPKVIVDDRVVDHQLLSIRIALESRTSREPGS